MPRSKTSNWKLRIALLTSLLLMSGCAGAISSCPPLKAYSHEFQARLRAEIAEMQEGSATLQAIEDYEMLRDQVRACR